MLLFKKKNILIGILAIVCTALILCFYSLYANSTSAMAYSSVPSGTIGNLYNENNNKFDINNLDSIAKSVGYTDIDDLLANVKANSSATTKGVKTAADFAVNNTTVKFGSYTFNGTKQELVWIPVYLSKSSNEVILTLWLVNSQTNGTISNQERSAWSNGTYYNTASKRLSYTENGKTYSLYANSYDGSYIRHYMLNSSTSYVKSSWGIGTLVTPPASSGMTKFTQFVSGGLLSQYIVKPSAVTWQMNESTYKNDPSYSNQTYYPTNWINDNIWLPSLSEVAGGGAGLWAATTNQCANSTYSWTRSGNSTGYQGSYGVSGGGDTWRDTDVFNTDSVRPALHLNLNKAVDNAVNRTDDPILDVSGTSKSVTYNGSAQSMDISNIDLNTVSYSTSGGLTTNLGSDNLLSVSSSAVGTYTVTVSINNTSEYRWAGGGSAQKEFKLNITQAQLSVSTDLLSSWPSDVAQTVTVTTNGVVDGENAELEVYYKPTGGSEVKLNDSGGGVYNIPANLTIGDYTFIVRLAPESNLNDNGNYKLTEYTQAFIITPRRIVDPTIDGIGGNSKTVQYTGSDQSISILNISNDVTYTNEDGLTESLAGGVLMLSATDINTYTVTVSLKDSVNTVWSSGGTSPKVFTFTITKATLTAALQGLPDEFPQDSNQRVTVSISGVADGDSVEYMVYYKSSTGGEVTLEPTNGVYLLTDLDVGEYVFGVRLTENDKYEMQEHKQNFEVTKMSAGFTDAYVQWQYTVNGGIEHLITGDTVELEYAGGSPYNFTLTMDSDALAAKGVKAEYDSVNVVEQGTYSVKVTVSALNDTIDFTTKTYTLYVTITKARFDLSAVAWNYDNKLPLQFTGARQTVSIISDTLPAGLSVDRYDPSSGNIAVGSYSTTVSFTVDAAYLVNYYVPDSSDPDTYKGNFDWTCNWRIVPQEINVAWVDAQHGYGDETFLVPKLVSGDNLVDYTYQVYKDGAWEDIDFPEYSNGTEVRYTVTATLQDNYSATYVLVGNPTKTFSIGLVKDPVSMQLKVNNKVISDGAQLAYTGKPIAATLSITGFLTSDCFTLTYYSADGTELSSPPSDSGNYKVIVTLKPEYSEDFYIDGDHEFSITILPEGVVPSDPDNPDSKPVIDPNIGEDGKFVAKDKDGNEINLDEYLDYTYYDKDGNEVDPNDFVDGEEYTAVATVKPEKEEEFKQAFENGEEMLEYLKDKSFTFIYHKKVSGCMGCAGGIDWILVMCIGLLLFDVVMFAITMRVIVGKKRDDEDEEDEEDDDEEYEFE